MSGRAVSDIQTRAEGESLYIRYNTDANVVNDLKNEVRLVVYDSYSGVCDRINTRTNVTFQISPSANEQ